MQRRPDAWFGHCVGYGSGTVEVNPAHVLSPGVATEIATARVCGHSLTAVRVKVDPTRVRPPGIAGEIAVIVSVHAIVGCRRVAVGVRVAAGVRAQQDPAHVLPPGISLQVVPIDDHPPLDGLKLIQPAFML